LRVLAFTAIVSLATGLGFGLVPAWSASRVEATSAQRSIASDAGRARWRPRLGRVIVGGQVAVSLILLVMAGLFVRTLSNLRDVDVGFATENVLAIRLEPPGSGQKWRNTRRLNRFYGDLMERVRQMPGVQEAGLVGDTPVSTASLLEVPVRVPGYVPDPDEKVLVRLIQSYPGNFSTLGIRILAGRDIEPADSSPDAPAVAVINQTMAERFFGSTQVVGRQFTEQWLDGTFRVVGVVADVRDRGLREAVLPTAYTPFVHTPSKFGPMTLLVRTGHDLEAVSSRIRQEVRAVEPRMTPPITETLAHRLDAALRQERLVALVSSLFGTLGLTLACVGLYGVVAYSASRRRVEFGVRMALGASAANVRRLVLVESLLLVGVGALVGLLGAGVAARLLSNMFFGLAPLDPASFAAATAGLGALAFIASYLPARQSSRVDPVITLRLE
jgi:predicted permease